MALDFSFIKQFYTFRCMRNILKQSTKTNFRNVLNSFVKKSRIFYMQQKFCISCIKITESWFCSQSVISLQSADTLYLPQISFHLLIYYENLNFEISFYAFTLNWLILHCMVYMYSLYTHTQINLHFLGILNKHSLVMSKKTFPTILSVCFIYSVILNVLERKI